ncbi:MAG: response regulator, partial [Bacillota bacterium]|nr:response regulator [Bacillota bacterium]
MQKIKIILVDDELTSRNTIKKYLENNDTYEVVADFVNGKNALEWLRKNKIDMILCDMQMPEINGVEL